MDQENIRLQVVKAIDRTARLHAHMRGKPSMAEQSATSAMVAEHLFDIAYYAGFDVKADISPLARMMFCDETTLDGGGRRGTYPWRTLETEGRFFWKTNDHSEARKVQASIAAAAWKRYGKGKIKTRCEHGGVWAIMRRREGGEGSQGGKQ